MSVETERSMLDRLNRRYDKWNGNGMRFTRAEHVKVTSGFDARRICDYMVFDLWTGGSFNSEAAPKLHGHEVKISRADWLTEMKDPSKAEAFAQYCDYFWLVIADKAMVKDGELPRGWGLMVPRGDTVAVVKQATQRVDVLPMPRHLQATLTRAVTKTAIRLDRAGESSFEYVVPRGREPVTA